MKKIFCSILLIFAGVFVFTSCKKNIQDNSPIQPPPTDKPASNAGIPQTITLPTDSIILDGSASTGAITSYHWTKISGPSSFSIQNPTAVKTVVKKLVQGVYQFELKVMDAGGLFSKDTVQITLKDQIARTGKGRIVEYGTDLPLPGVTVEAWLQNGSRLHIVTDTIGEFPFDGNNFGLSTVTKAGYWTGFWNINFDLQGYYLFPPITFFPGNVSFDKYSGHISSCDSFVIKLFPKKYITIHIKDSLGLCRSGDCNVIFTVNGLFTQQGANQTFSPGLGLPDHQNGEFTMLRPYIDTTFQYPVCGDTVNSFNIGDYAFDSGWYVSYLHSDTIFIPNNNNMILNISY